MYPERVTESKGANIGGQGRLATVLGIGLVVLTLCFVVHAVVCTLQIAALREEVAQLQKWKLSLEDGRQGSAADDDTGSRGIHTHARGRKGEEEETEAEKENEIDEDENEDPVEHLVKRATKKERKRKKGARAGCPKKCRGKRGVQGERGQPGEQGERGPQGEKGERGEAAPAQKSVAIHFMAYTPEESHNLSPGENAGPDKYRGLTTFLGYKSSDGVLRYWREDEGMSHPDVIELTAAGTVRIKQSGIYFIYSQVTFHDASSENAHNVKVNDVTFVTCSDSVDATNIELAPVKNAKIKSCYVGANKRLNEGDVISITHSYRNRIVNMNAKSTYFGFIKFS